MKQNKCSGNFSSTSDYVLCDTAFKPINIFIPGHKTVSAFYQNAEKVKHDKAMYPPGVITEHTMDRWKG